MHEKITVKMHKNKKNKVEKILNIEINLIKNKLNNIFKLKINHKIN
jgi:hypothetical protein